jgi:nucleoside-diphosphate-sugar epimerase
LVKALVEENHEVYAITRGTRKAYGYDEQIWNKVHVITMDKTKVGSSGIFDEIQPDVVCDLVAYDVESVKETLSGLHNDAFYLQIGSIWIYNDKEYVPVDENHPKTATGVYGINKGKVEEYLAEQCRQNKLRGCVLHVGHVSGKEWQPINPQGNLDIAVFDKLKNGEELLMPFRGLTTMQHVHSSDIARAVLACIYQQDKANGEAFIVTAEKAVTLRTLCKIVAGYYGKEPNLKYVSWEEFAKEVDERNAFLSEDHMSKSPCCSVDKIKRVLGVEFKYSIADIFKEYLDFQEGKL